MKAYINDKGNVIIGNTEINEKIFSQEMSGYTLIERTSQIDDLYMWIGEAIYDSNRCSDVYLMKEDLHYLESLEDEFVFSSYSTNEFIAKSDDGKRFNEICEDILKINKELKK